MPRYFFHAECGEFIPDLVGVDLSGFEAARHMAASYLAELISDEAEGFWSKGEARVGVTDQDGQALFSVTAGVQTADAADLPLASEAALHADGRSPVERPEIPAHVLTGG